MYTKEYSQKEALETSIDLIRKLMESTQNSFVQNSLESALMYLGQVRSHVIVDQIPERGYSVGHTIKVPGPKIKVQL